jgi:hypothetical protein
MVTIGFVDFSRGHLPRLSALATGYSVAREHGLQNLKD